MCCILSALGQGKIQKGGEGPMMVVPCCCPASFLLSWTRPAAVAIPVTLYLSLSGLTLSCGLGVFTLSCLPTQTLMLLWDPCIFYFRNEAFGCRFSHLSSAFSTFFTHLCDPAPQVLRVFYSRAHAQQLDVARAIDDSFLPHAAPHLVCKIVHLQQLAVGTRRLAPGG